MLVILCHAGDTAALWLHDTLRRLGLASLELVAVEQVVFSRSIVHRLDGAGDTGAIQLADSRVLRPEAITGLVNRVQFLPTQHFAAAAAADRAYATEELAAFMLAWLDGIAGRVINPPLPAALGGGAFPEVVITHSAAMAGLPTRPWRRTDRADIETVNDPNRPLSSTYGVVALDGRLFGPLIPRRLQDGCRRLAVLLGVPLLQVLFQHSTEAGWWFAGATGFADFRLGGEPLAAAIARALSVERGG
jgi:hypothetical protein